MTKQIEDAVLDLLDLIIVESTGYSSDYILDLIVKDAIKIRDMMEQEAM